MKSKARNVIFDVEDGLFSDISEGDIVRCNIAPDRSRKNLMRVLMKRTIEEAKYPQQLLVCDMNRIIFAHAVIERDQVNKEIIMLKETVKVDETLPWGSTHHDGRTPVDLQEGVRFLVWKEYLIKLRQDAPRVH